jgi:branched-chain amino acid transport system substrate-binding protein
MNPGFVIAVAMALAFVPPAEAQISVKFGVLNDRSGVYSDLTGEGSVVAARMAVEDYKAADKGIEVDIVAADHQNKPDVGASIARRWYDVEGVDVILDVPTSSVVLSINTLTREKNKILIVSGGGTSDLTGAQCSPNTGTFRAREWKRTATRRLIGKASWSTWKRLPSSSGLNTTTPVTFFPGCA